MPLLACLLPQFAVADENAGRILAPSPGRPAFVDAGGEFAISAALPGGATVSEARLVHPRLPRVAYRLTIPATFGADVGSGVPFRVTAPANVPARTYDLELRNGSDVIRARHCVAVGARRDPLRLVHLGDMNIGDLSVPAFEPRLIDDINLLAPTAIVLTGDLIDATHPHPEAAWPQLVERLCEFDAPLIIAAGDHDDGDLFSRFIAPSPIGALELGPHRFIVLHDHVLAPLARDADQFRWAEGALHADCAGLRFVVSHSIPAASLIPKPAKMANSNPQFSFWFCGGGPVHTKPGRDSRIVQTPPASSLTARDGDGVSRYRVLDLDSTAKAASANPPAPVLAAGSLRMALDAPNDCASVQVRIAALNQQGLGFARLSAFVRVRKTGTHAPWIRGATLESTADLGDCWECRVGFDLPEKSTLRAMVGTGTPPAEAKVRIGFDLPSQIPLSASRDGQRGLLQPGASNPMEVTLSNAGDAALDCSPLVRLDGDLVPWRIDGRTRDFVLTAQLRIEPRETLALRLDFSDARVRPGRRSLVVYVNDGQTLTPVTREFDAVPSARPPG